MEDQKFDGGPAFPQPCTENGYAANSPYQMAGGGISMRDYFAAKAMGAMLASLEYTVYCRDTLSADAYLIADAMIAARNA